MNRGRRRGARQRPARCCLATPRRVGMCISFPKASPAEDMVPLLESCQSLNREMPSQCNRHHSWSTGAFCRVV